MENSTLVTPDRLVQLLTFSWLDYTIFFLMFGVSALIGIYFGCFGSKQSTTSEYLLGSRAMGVFPIAMSLTAGHLSGITLLGIPSEIYMYGTQYWLCSLSAILVSIIVIYVYLPVFYNLGVNSSYEYLHIRFDEKIRTIALVIYIVASLLYIPIVIYIPALAFNQVSGIAIHKITPIICGVCIFYTTVGGLKAVVWTDTLQFGVTIASMIGVFFMGIHSAGGFGNIWELSDQGSRIEFFNMDPDPTVRTTFWGVIIGMTISWTNMVGVSPTAVQRFMAVPSLTKAKTCVWLFGLGVIITKALTCFTGLIMYAKYKDCDPFTSGKIKRADQILPYYVLDVARDIPGLSGLFVSGVFSTALSTMSAHLNTLGGTIYEDFIKRYMPEKSTEAAANKIIKSTVVITGIICTALVFVVEKLGGVFQISGCFSGVTTGPMLGLFTLGMLFPSATSKGAFYGSITALTFMSFIVGGFEYHYLRGTLKYQYKPLSVEQCDIHNSTFSNITTTESTLSTFSDFTTSLPEIQGDDVPFFLFRVSFYWYALMGAVMVVVIGLLVSWISKEENDHKYNKAVYSPIVHRFVPVDEKEYTSIGQALGQVTVQEELQDEDVKS